VSASVTIGRPEGLFEDEGLDEDIKRMWAAGSISAARVKGKSAGNEM
jgi:hypothetical protein